MPKRISLPLLALAAACATAPVPSRTDYLLAADQQYPKMDYIVGYGFGQTPELAEGNAQADAASSISSVIEQNVTILEGETVSDGNRTSEQKVSSELKQRVKSDAGALIRPVRELTREARGGFEAIAVVSRKDLDDKYRTQIAPMLEKLNALYDRAINAGGNAEDLAGALCELDAIEKQVEEKDKERRLVSRTTSWTDDIVGKRKVVAGIRQKIKASAELLVMPESAKVPTNVSDQFVKQLVSAGFSARIVNEATCGGKSTLVKLNVEPSCGKAPLAGLILCKSKYVSSATKCGGNETLFAFASDQGVGMHSTDAAIAEKEAVNKTDLRKFTTGVLGRLFQVFGEGCEK